MEKMNGESLDIVADNITKLKQIFPEVFNQDKVDFEKLEQVLGEYKDTDDERYSFIWPGKAQAIRIAQTPSTGTLRPCKEESVNWDETENLYIEGDNLEVLKLLQKPYYGKVKMIYIDPPYNTGNDFVYKDNFKDNISNYLQVTGQVDSDGRKNSTNSEAGGRYHTNWLNMIYPRLKLAKNLLSEKGAIFISIDDSELYNLKQLCNEVFGEENFVANVIWKRKRGRDNSAKWFSKSHEYLLIYAKAKECFEVNYLELDEETKQAYKNPDNDPRGIYRMLGVWARGTQGGSEYDFTNKHGQYFEKRLWLMAKENLQKLDGEDKLIVRGDNIYRKLFITENKGRIPETIWDNVSNAANASDEIKKIFGSIVFDTAKPTPYIEEILKIATNKDDLILDFFSGSATTANAVMTLNAKDNGNRKYIMVQLPEYNGDDKGKYSSICEIAKERIAYSGKGIKNEYLVEIDYGFKVLKLDTSNIKAWDASLNENIEEQLFNMVNNIKEDRSEEDILFEILLKYGVDLNAPIEEQMLADKKVYAIGFGAIIACLADNITLDVVEAIGKLKEDLDPGICRVVFKDKGFASDAVKTNAVQILKRYDIHEVKSI